VDLERALLSKITDTKELAKCWDLGLRPEAFEDIVTQDVYRFSIQYYLDNAMSLAPTRAVLEHEYPAFKTEDSDEATTWLVEALQKRHATNDLQQMMKDVAVTVTDDPMGAVRTIYQSAWSTLSQVAPRHNRTNFADTIQERRNRYLERATSRNQIKGAPLGLTEVDEHIGGIHPGELAVVVGSAKTGKSMKLLNAAAAARRAGFTPCIFTLEMAISEFEDRLDAFHSGIGYGKIQRGELTEQELEQLYEAQETFKELGPTYIEKPARGERTVAALTNRARQLGSDFLIIDQLSFMDAKSSRYRQTTTEKHAEIIADLKDDISNPTTGAELPCLLAVQFNRQAASSKAEDRGGLFNIANSSMIEQTVDFAFGLWRNREMRANRSMVFDVMGARRGDIGSWLLEWHLNNRTRIAVRGPYEG
jgi:replicative DNA helicase